MIKAFYASRGWAFWAYGGLALLISSLYIQVQFTVAFNSWYGRFYNLLQTSDNFKESSHALYDWAPIADELKVLDKKIVINSMCLKWENIEKEFSELINF